MKMNNTLILENSKKLNVLYVEDDDALRESTGELFNNFFNSVRVAVNGEDGLEEYIRYFNEKDCYYDLIISDINMPIMDGLVMSEKLKEINYNQSILFVTAFNETNYLHKAIELGVNGFLTKPIAMEQLIKVLYTVSQAIVDRKLVEKYYKQIEDSNVLHITLEDASTFESTKDILDNLVQHQEEISKLWVQREIVQKKLKKHTIDGEYFRTHYGLKVIEYFLDVVRGKVKAGNCPVMIMMIEFFKHKELPLEDIFMICIHFKNTLTDYIFSRYSFNHELFDDVSFILDKNFEGVIIQYGNMKENSQEEISSIEKCSSKKNTGENIEEHINYIEYVIESDIYELKDLEEEIDSLAISVTMSSNSPLEDYSELGRKIKRYGTILNNYPLFCVLGESVSKLGGSFEIEAQLLFDDKERMSNISSLVEGFVNDLIIWRKEIFENNIENPHFLDSSFFSNVDTIIMFIEYDESAVCGDENDGDMEFF